MSPREALVSETRQWLERAQADSHACAVLIAAGLTAEALFHAQLCAEKAIKAVLTWHQIPYRKTHDLDELRQVCLPLAGSAAIHLTGIERLSHYALRFRYPGAPPRSRAVRGRSRWTCGRTTPAGCGRPARTEIPRFRCLRERGEERVKETPLRCLVWVSTKQPNGGIRLLEVAGRSVRYSCLGLSGEATASPSQRRWARHFHGRFRGEVR